MTTPLRRIFGGSDRRHHLAMSCALSMPLAALTYTNPGVSIAGVFLQMPHDWLWLVASLGCYGQELWATADRDVEPSRKGGLGHLYWLPYGHAIPHRNRLSHGLVIGTVIRLAYGWWPLLPVLWVVYPPLMVAWCVGAFVNDLGHLALDL